MTRVAELVSAYEHADTVDDAERILDELVAVGGPQHVRLGDLYDDLALAASEAGDFGLAVRSERRAIDIGCDRPDIAEEMLAWYLLKAGRRDEGEAAFADLRRDRGDDPGIVLTHANARMDAGDGDGAVQAFDEALVIARRIGDDAWAEQILDERRYCRRELGLEPDADDVRTPMIKSTDDRQQVRWSVAWFPRDEIGAALERWPSLENDLDDPDAYCGSIERRLHEITVATGRRPSLAPLRVAALVGFAEARGIDADSGAARGGFAAAADRLGESLEWPPGRNEPCWCGSGRKYKRCCALKA